jgi:hypothetical protein
MATFLTLLAILLAADIHVERERAGPERRDPRRRVGATREKPEDTPYRGSPRLRSSPSRPATANGGILLAKFGPLSSCRMASAREAPVHTSKECEVTPSCWQHAPARRLAGVAPIGWSTTAAPCLRRRNLVPFLLGDGPTTKQPCDDLCGGGLGPCPTHFNAA